jgi:hypothetical protein
VIADPAVFTLSKWYLDCVTDDGSAFIGYWARLAWRRLSIRYASAFVSPADGEPRLFWRLTHCAEPRETEGAVRWSSRRLGIHASWERLTTPLSRRLFVERGSVIDWDCRAPAARARVSIRRERPLEGAGYVERMTMTFPPWEAPIEELRGGRFVSGSRAVVWIGWRGPRPLTLVFSDGREIPEPAIEADGIRLEGSRLDLSQTRVVSEGPLIPGAVADSRAFSSLPMARLARAREVKSLSRGTLTEPAGGTCHGWALHERVRLDL